MSLLSQPPQEGHDQDLRLRVRREIAAGRFDAALALCDRAIDAARERGDHETLDQATCNRASILIAQGRGEGVVGELRRILMRSTDRGNRFHAAYAISQHHETLEQAERSLFYARQALRYAEDWGDTHALATAHNRLANLLMLDSYFTEASDHYHCALGLQGGNAGVERAILLSNLGYCQAVVGSLALAFRSLTRSLRMMQRLHAEHWQHLPRLGLSFAYLELGRYGRARRHARRALELAEDGPHAGSQVKNALYLLGEAEKLAGDEIAAYECFARLQRRFYPEEPFVVDVLMAADIRKLVNLMA